LTESFPPDAVPADSNANLPPAKESHSDAAHADRAHTVHASDEFEIIDSEADDELSDDGEDENEDGEDEVYPDSDDDIPDVDASEVSSESASDVPVEPGVLFSDLGLIPPLMEALNFCGYKSPSPIQAQMIPLAIQGRDCLGQAQTGTGKTAAFLLPLMNSWRGGDLKSPQALVMVPTRELAVQVARESDKISPSRFFRTVPIYGGQKFGPQARQLEQGCTLVVGTPGRMLDHLQRGTINLDKVRYVVLDEADRMLDIGFRPQIERIMRRLPEKRQTLLMSATMPPIILKMMQRYMVDPVHINLSPDVLTVDRINQSVITVDEDRKFDLLVLLLEREKPRQCVIFCETKRGSDRLVKKLKPTYPSVAALHGDLPQTRREKIMAAFRAVKLHAVIATDVMSRGIDVSGISHIINYDLPNDIENYVHRIGRTGRMGADGRAISFVTPEQGTHLTDIEKTINRLIPTETIEGFNAVRPREKTEGPKPSAPSKPVYGRPNRRYSNRL